MCEDSKITLSAINTMTLTMSVTVTMTTTVTMRMTMTMTTQLKELIMSDTDRRQAT